MHKKLGLKLSDDFAEHVAVEKLADMVVSYIEGREHAFAMGGEQGDIPGWDDFVVENKKGDYTHLQIKRQQSDFLPKAGTCERNWKKKGIGNYYDLSELDKVFEHLANWIKKDETDNTNKHDFILILPNDNQQIKKELTVSQFTKFCEQHIKKNSSASKLEDLQNVDKHKTAINIYNWLNSWCGFENWEQILQALRLLKFQLVEIEQNIKTRTYGNLKGVFDDAEKVYTQIKSIIHEEGIGYTVELTPQGLLHELKDHLSSRTPYWTQFEKTDNNWSVSGTHDLEQHQQERASKVVDGIWSNGYKSIWKIITPTDDHGLNAPLSNVLRIALHANGNSSVYLTQSQTWIEVLKMKAGYTLGEIQSDFDNLSFIEDNNIFTSANVKLLDTISKRNTYSDELEDEITRSVWSKVKMKVNKKIENDTSPHLQVPMETRWNQWKTILDQNNDLLKEMLISMLHPKGESQAILGELRLGKKTVDLITKGFWYQLAIAITLTTDSNQIDKIGNLKLSTVSLKYWSGPDGDKVKSINSGSVKAIVGKESDVLILANNTSSLKEIYQETLAQSNSNIPSMANGNHPKLLVTDSLSFQRIIDEGTLDQLKAYVIKLTPDDTEIDTTIDQIADGI